MNRVALVGVAAAMGALFAACTLNPQPLPPDDGDDEKNAPATGAAGGDTTSSGGGFEGTPSNSADAGAPREAGADASDDASTDAPSDG